MVPANQLREPGRGSFGGIVDIVAEADEARFRALMQAHHYLGALRAVGETVRYVARHRDRCLAIAVFSAPALKCGARDRWIGWDRSLQFGRLHLVSNNSRFLILPGAPRNLGSRVLSLCARRVVRDWPARFGHGILLLETFVDPARFHGTVYRAANWIEAGLTRGFVRHGRGYVANERPKRVFLLPLFLLPLSRAARSRLHAFRLDPRLQHGVPRMTLSVEHMETLPDFVQEPGKPEHGRLERRSIWVSSEINEYAEFPGAGLRRAPRGHPGQDRREERRDRLRGHEPGSRGRRSEAPA